MSKPSSTVRSLPYPAIENGNFSFPKGDYQVDSQLSGNSGTKVLLRHQLSGASFIENLIKKGEAKFACFISVPKTAYRKLHLADTSEQEVTWDLDVVGEPPKLLPVILYVGGGLKHKLTKQDGVATVWQKRKVKIPKGARLARGRYLQPSATIQDLLYVRHKNDMKPGSFAVKDHTNNGFYFSLDTATDIFMFLQSPQGNSLLRDSILAHAVSRCFGILRKDYGTPEGDDQSEDHWNQYSNLRALADKLVTQDMPHWGDEDFDPVKTATELYPIRVPTMNEEE